MSDSASKAAQEFLDQFKRELWFYIKDNIPEELMHPDRKEELKSEVDRLIREKVNEAKIPISEQLRLHVVDSYLCRIPMLASEYLDENDRFLPSVKERHRLASSKRPE